MGVDRKLLFYKFVRVGGRLEVVDRNNFPVHMETGYRMEDYMSEEEVDRVRRYYRKWYPDMEISE